MLQPHVGHEANHLLDPDFRMLTLATRKTRFHRQRQRFGFPAIACRVLALPESADVSPNALVDDIQSDHRLVKQGALADMVDHIDLDPAK